MLILKLKKDGYIYKDQLGNEYPDMVIALARREDPWKYKPMDLLNYYNNWERLWNI